MNPFPSFYIYHKSHQKGHISNETIGLYTKDTYKENINTLIINNFSDSYLKALWFSNAESNRPLC